MMRSLSLSAMMLMLFLSLAACSTSSTPASGDPPPKLTTEQKMMVANDAGAAAILAWVVIEHPDKDKATAVKVVVDKVQLSLSDYREGGFSATLPSLEVAVDVALPGDAKAAERQLGYKLAKTLLNELDKVFDKHPDWKVKGSDAANLVKSFCSGASGSLDGYIAGH